MVDYLHQHPEARIILVEKTDRLYRNLKENVVLSADSRSSEKFMHGIKVLMAKGGFNLQVHHVGRRRRHRRESVVLGIGADAG